MADGMNDMDRYLANRQTLIDGHFVLGYPEKGEAMGKLDPARLQAQYKILRDLNVLSSDFDFTKSYTDQFTQKP